MFRVEAHKGNSQVFNLISRLSPTMRANLRASLYEQGDNIVRSIRADFRKPKTGRIYKVRVGKSGQRLARARRHQASAPGEAPARLSGALDRSIDFNVRGNNLLTVGAGTVYARYLEETLNRPYLRTNIEANQRNSMIHFKNAVLSSFRMRRR